MVMPMTTDRNQAWAIVSPDLYPRFAAGVAGLNAKTTNSTMEKWWNSIRE